MIVTYGKDKEKQGWIICAGCGAREKHPTAESDRWLACWCADPDRCLGCGECAKCWEEFS